MGAVPTIETEALWLQAALTSVSGMCGPQQVRGCAREPRCQAHSATNRLVTSASAFLSPGLLSLCVKCGYGTRSSARS